MQAEEKGLHPDFSSTFVHKLIATFVLLPSGGTVGRFTRVFSLQQVAVDDGKANGRLNQTVVNVMHWKMLKCSEDFSWSFQIM